jgi:multisubunit Na+/H+ antiporter MnhE subunit
MPRYLTVATLAVALWVGVTANEVLAGALPAAVVIAVTGAAYVLWARRGRRWHDGTVIVLLLPALGAALWIATGGLVMEIERSNEERLLTEVGPGLALTGLLCTLISYHGRHHPTER